MITKNEHIKYLYQKYLNHTATSEEFDQLFNYLQNPENLEILKQEMSREWRSDNDQDRLSPLFWKEIDVEIRKRKALERSKALKRKNRRFWLATAASFLLIVGISLLIYLNAGSGEYLIYTTDFGEVEKITLDDGSQVTLNANSVLQWKNDWKDEGKRIAILDGEAYFDVESILDNQNRKTGFDVQTNDLTIQVVGTSFNVKSRTEKTDIFLDEGKIHLDLTDPDKESNQKLANVEIVMNPGESVSYSAKTKILDRAVSDQFGNASWMAGTFMYTNQTVAAIFQSLEEIYGVEFQVKDIVFLNRRLTTNLPYSDWPIVESALELLLQVKLEKQEDKIIITKRE